MTSHLREMYLKCQERGHKTGYEMLDCGTMKQVCRCCGTHFIYVIKIVEVGHMLEADDNIQRWEDEGGS